MEAKQFTLKAKTPKNQAILNRTIKALVKYNNLNNQRDKADDSGDEKLYRKLNRQCEVAFDKYLELADELPKYEKDRLENSDVYLHYAKGGITEHGLEIGDKITGRGHGDKIEGYNKEMRETFTTDLDKGKRSSIRYAKGGKIKVGDMVELQSGQKAKVLRVEDAFLYVQTSNNRLLDVYTKDVKKMAKGGKTKQDPPIVRGYFEDEAIDYAKGGKMARKDGFKSYKTYVMHDAKDTRYVLSYGDIWNTPFSIIFISKFQGTKYVKDIRHEILTKNVKSFVSKFNNENIEKIFNALYKHYKQVKKTEDSETMAKGGKTKQDPPIVRGYFEDEAIDYGQGGSMTGWCYSIGGL